MVTALELFFCVRLACELLEPVPAGIGRSGGGSGISIHVVHLLHELVLKFRILVAVGGAGTVLLEDGTHLTVTFSQRMHMLDRNGERYSIVDQLGHIEISIAFRYLEQVIRVVIVSIAILYSYVILSINRQLHVVKTTVADQRQLSADEELQIVEV